MRGRFLFLSCLHAFRNPVYLKIYVGITCSIRCVLHMKVFLVQMNSNWDMPELGRTKSDTALNEMKYSQNFWQFLCHVTIKVNRDLDVQLYTQCNGREKEIKRCHQYFKATSMDWRLLKLCTHFSFNRYIQKKIISNSSRNWESYSATEPGSDKQGILIRWLNAWAPMEPLHCIVFNFIAQVLQNNRTTKKTYGSRRLSYFASITIILPASDWLY
jgi:hypothetical protein